MDPDVGAHRPVDEGKEEPERERRLLLCNGLLLVRYSDGSLHPDFCDCPLFRMVCTRPRTSGRQSALPPAERVYRRARWQAGYSYRSTRLEDQAAAFSERRFIKLAAGRRRSLSMAPI